MPTRPSRPAVIPAGYDDTVPALADIRNPFEANRALPFEPFSDDAAGYMITLIEQWCDRNTSQAAHELRFLLEQAKWTTGYKPFARLALDALPENRPALSRPSA